MKPTEGGAWSAGVKEQSRLKRIFNMQSRSTQLVLAKSAPYAQMELKIKQFKLEKPAQYSQLDKKRWNETLTFMDQARRRFFSANETGSASLSKEKRDRAIARFNFRPNWFKRKLIQFLRYVTRP